MTRSRWSLFTYPIMDIKAAEALLNRRAAEGWALDRVYLGTFARFVPADIRSAWCVDWSRPGYSERPDYLALCADAGWTLVQKVGAFNLYKAPVGLGRPVGPVPGPGRLGAAGLRRVLEARPPRHFAHPNRSFPAALPSCHPGSLAALDRPSPAAAAAVAPVGGRTSARPQPVERWGGSLSVPSLPDLGHRRCPLLSDRCRPSDADGFCSGPAAGGLHRPVF